MTRIPYTGGSRMSSASMKNFTTYDAVFGKTLVQLRKEKGWDQAQCARKMGFSRPTWSRIENGVSSLSVAQLQHVSEVFGIAPKLLLDKVDAACDLLKEHGIVVESTRPKRKSIATGWLLVSGAVLAGIVIAATSGTDSRSETQGRNDKTNSKRS